MKKFKTLVLAAGLAAIVTLAAACSDDDSAEEVEGPGNTAAVPASPSAPVGSPGSVRTGQEASAAALAGLPAAPQYQVGSSQAGIWVTGQGTVTLAPDLALLSLSVEAQGEIVSDAVADAAIAMDGINAALRDRGIEDRDVQTQYFNIRPQYEFPEVLQGGSRTRTQVLVGYFVTNTVIAKIRDLDSVGSVIDEVATAGGDATRINSISFTVEDDGPFAVQLRELAVNDALAKARHFADLGRVTLGRMVFITESGGGTPIVQDFAAESFGLARAALAPKTSISGGELDLQLNVQVVFEIQ